MKKVANFFYNVMCKFESVVSMAMLTITVSVTTINVIARYLFRESIPWANEVSGIAWTWTVMLGISWCFRRNMHMGVDFLLNKIGPKARRIVQTGSFVILLASCAFMLYMSIQITILGGYKLTSYFQIPYAIKYISADIAFFNMTIYSMMFIYLGIKKPEEFLRRVELDGNGLDPFEDGLDIAGIPAGVEAKEVK